VALIFIKSGLGFIFRVVRKTEFILRLQNSGLRIRLFYRDGDMSDNPKRRSSIWMASTSVVFLITAGLVLGTMQLATARTAQWSIWIVDGVFGLSRIKGGTFLLFNQSVISISGLFDIAPIFMLLIGAFIGVLIILQKHSGRKGVRAD
jgi:hypothetical protein